ncbi:hypothetical protein [Streptomyces sp. B1I3]|uniref:hypothetical protein n=1 Tax=Streptomyces sp. B1I3 TaxID=3042264 RepID=UPI0027876258|nr:hypothetical protein [Streptomyces sp. B1I3]MDQ0793563.1 hypothetical protein [Streptomyces sp. B1I3]
MSTENTEAHDALNTMLNGEESNEVETQETETTEEVTEENEVAETEETDDNKFTKEYVEGLRKEAAKHRVDAKETKEALEELKKTSKAELAEKTKAIEEANLALTRYKIAAKYSVSEEHTELFLTGSDEETLEKQAAALNERTVKTPKPDRAQGNRNGNGATSNAELFANALGF